MKRVLILIALLVFPVLGSAQGGMGPGPGVKSYGSAPADFVTDTFTDTDATLLSAHTGELGATWTKHPSYTATITIQSNRAHKDTDSATAAYYASGVPANANYTVEGVLMDLTATTRTSAICGWFDTTTNTGVCMRRASSTSVELIKIIAGVVTTGLDSEAVTYTQDLLREFKIARSGTNYEWFLDDVSLGVVAITDTELSGVGRVAVRQTGQWTASTTYPISSIRAYQ